ncbi:IclR family transcriptional regulator [Leucobacter sp. BZR 635]
MKSDTAPQRSDDENETNVDGGEMADAKPHRTVSRVTDVLEMVASAGSDGLRLMDIADQLAAPRSSTHGLVKGLEAQGYLTERNSRYTLGNAIGSLLSPRAGAETEATRDAMLALQAQFNETVMLGVRVGDNVVYLHSLESLQLVRYSAPLRVRRPLYPTSSGRCFLAFATDGDRDRYLQANVEAAQVPALLDELAEIRESYVAVNQGDTVADVYGVSAPIFDASGIARTLSVAGPKHRLIDQIPELRAALSNAALAVQSAGHGAR